MQFKLRVTRIVFCLFSVAAGISLKLSTNPVIFGKTVQLTCNLSGPTPCCHEFTRKWLVGKKYDLIVINGISSNKSKYEEILDINARTSTLLIKNFKEDNLKLYQCTYGFEIATKVLKISENIYEYHPLESIPIMLKKDDDSSLAFNITFEKIFPIPHCHAIFGHVNVSSNLTVLTTKNGTMFTSTISFTYCVDNNCDQTIFVYCTLVKTRLVIANNVIPCKADKPLQHKATWETYLIIGPVILIMMYLTTCIVQYKWTSKDIHGEETILKYMILKNREDIFLETKF